MNVIGIDLGGTKVAAGVVSPKGKILEERKVPTELKDGWPGLKRQLAALCCGLIADHGKVAAIGIGSAGPLHAPSGKLLDPTNFGWPAAIVPIASLLSKSMKVPVRLENDAAAAVLAEHWKGGGGRNCVVVTLGTGLGVGVMIEGKLLRGARGLHPEAGHIIIRPGDPTALCGCGNYGCAEALLSGVNFGHRVGAALGKRDLTAKHAAELASKGNKKILEMFSEYSELMAVFLLNLVTLFYPEKIILTGSFAEAHPLFLPRTEKRLRELLKRRLDTMPIYPNIRVSRLGNRAGVLGAAFVAMHKSYCATP